MPRKPKKTREEKSAEEYFSAKGIKKTTEKAVKEKVSRKDLLKRTTEKAVKEENNSESYRKGSIEKKVRRINPKEIETVEYSPRKKRTKKKKTSTRTVTKEKKYSPPKILLKKNGYELIITEKPQAAQKIASALGDSKKLTNKGVSYYEVDREGKKIIVACAVGHLFTLAQNTKGTKVPTFDISWTPNFIVRKKDFTKKYYDTLLKVAKNAGSLTVATDFDIEGEVIGINVVKFICNQKDAKRMKFSTLTTDELNEAYENKLPSIEWRHAIAGETRHYLDWFYGINLSRALMNAIKTTGKFKIMSIGRVQGPALNMIIEKEREIKKFKPVSYWVPYITIKQKRKKLELKHTKDIFDKKELIHFEKLKGKIALMETKKKKESIKPNPPFNLTALQTESYKLYGITPANTLKAAQSLYLTGLISYPRTSSQKLPKSIGYDKILKKLSKKFKVEHLIKKKTPIEGKKEDPAHPSIYPTGQEGGVLSGDDEKVYNLIVKRFLSLFCEAAEIEKKRVTAKVENLTFSANGKETIKKAWLEIYPTKSKDKELQDFEGDAEIIDERIEEKETQPPKRYSPASILSELEKRNLGTKATRANILETLYDRGYVKDTSITATPLGMSLIETLEKHSPIIIDEELTRNFEQDMEEIEKSKDKDLLKEEDRIIEEAKKAIEKISEDFKEKEEKIGKELMNSVEKQREQEKKENTLNLCPKCKKGHLSITYSPRFKRQFIACNAYPKCKNTFSLPPNGIIKQVKKDCEKCGFPLLMTLRKGKRPWIFCFNPECDSNKERIEEYKRKKAEEEEEEN
jgi:DNA topoisomerase-1